MLKGDLTSTPFAPLLLSLAEEDTTGCLHISDAEGDEALVYFKRAHALRPENWTYKRQAWSFGDIERDYGTTFQEAVKDPASGPFYPPLDLTD